MKKRLLSRLNPFNRPLKPFQSQFLLIILMVFSKATAQSPSSAPANVSAASNGYASSSVCLTHTKQEVLKLLLKNRDQAEQGKEALQHLRLAVDDKQTGRMPKHVSVQGIAGTRSGDQVTLSAEIHNIEGAPRSFQLSRGELTITANGRIAQGTRGGKTRVMTEEESVQSIDFFPLLGTLHTSMPEIVFAGTPSANGANRIDIFHLHANPDLPQLGSYVTEVSVWYDPTTFLISGFESCEHRRPESRKLSTNAPSRIDTNGYSIHREFSSYKKVDFFNYPSIVKETIGAAEIRTIQINSVTTNSN